MNHTTDLAQLREAPFFTDFSERMLVALVPLARRVYLKAGDTVFREGQKQAYLYLISSGHVVLEMCVPARECLRILSLGPGDLLAWSALLGHGMMTTSAICQEDVELLAFEGPAILALCDTDHEIGYRVMRQLAQALARRLVGTRLQLLDLFGVGAQETVYE